MVAADVTAVPLAKDQAPLIRIAHASPLELRGVRFVAGEHVRLMVKLGPSRVVRFVTADETGGFSARFPGFKVARCGPTLSVSALGGRGSRVGWTLNQVACGSVMTG
jgi:hypothetical protein